MPETCIDVSHCFVCVHIIIGREIEKALSFKMLLFLLSSLLCLSGGHCYLPVHTALTTGALISRPFTPARAPSHHTRVIRCPPPSPLLLVRTAYYLPHHPTPRHGPGTRPLPCPPNPQGCAPDHGASRRERMTSSDVMKVYRHCQDQTDWCDVANAGVDKDFEISYYCLAEPYINPCSNITAEVLADNTSILLNYSRHTADCSLTCKCTVTATTSQSSSPQTLYIRALNLFQDREEGHDMMGDKTFPDADVFVAEGCVGTREQPEPRVLIESSVRRWEVERRAVPVQWQLGENESSSLSLIFQGLHGIQFGRLWMNFKGGASHLLTYVGVGVGGSVVTVLTVVIIAVAMWKLRPSASKRPRTNGHNILHVDNKLAHDNSANDIQLGDYCTMNDVTSTSSAQHPMTFSQSRGDRQRPIDEETNFCEMSGCDSGERTTPRVRERDGENEYGTLNHGPRGGAELNRPTAEPVIYDHAGTLAIGGDYHCLRHYVSSEPRVIDNIYDTVSTTATS
ncbi:hypothetical protein ACOMHN_013906 [Nucella lapillus]